MTKNIDLSKENLFPVGELFNSENFSGQVWLKMLTQDPSCPVVNVTLPLAAAIIGIGTMAASCYWSPVAAAIIRVGTTGREPHPGDVVEIPAEVKHWHGACSGKLVLPFGDRAAPRAGSCSVAGAGC